MSSLVVPPPAPPCVLEVCVDSVASALAAERGGAARVELCSGLLDGGLTPSAGLIAAVRRAVTIPVMVLIRPRPGDFVYDAYDFEVMRDDIAQCRRMGVAGVVSGVLLPSGHIDTDRTRQLLEAATAPHDAAPPLLFTFHRAIDVVPDMSAALTTLVQLGVPRVLTSGGAPDVIQGQQSIIALVQQAAGRIIVLAGGGVSVANAAAFVQATGVREVHASLRSFRWGATQPSARKPHVYMGGEKKNDGVAVEYGLKAADEQHIRSVVQQLQQLQ